MRFTLRDGVCTLGYGVVTDLMEDIDFDDFEEHRLKEKKLKAKSEKS